MNHLGDIFLTALHIILHCFALMGILMGLGLIAVPDMVQKLESFLNRKLLDSARKPAVGQQLDQTRNIEHLFFNHHIVSGLILVLVPSILIVLLTMMPEMQADPVRDFSTPAWILFCKVILYPTFLTFVWWVAIFATLFGLMVMLAPQYAFRLLRLLNRDYPTDHLTLALQEDIPLNQVFYRNAPVFGALFIILSVVLLLLLLKT
jgi:hypothetical protein